jgi:hypothetical protein
MEKLDNVDIINSSGTSGTKIFLKRGKKNA